MWRMPFVRLDYSVWWERVRGRAMTRWKTTYGHRPWIEFAKYGHHSYHEPRPRTSFVLVRNGIPRICRPAWDDGSARAYINWGRISHLTFRTNELKRVISFAPFAPNRMLSIWVVDWWVWDERRARAGWGSIIPSKYDCQGEKLKHGNWINRIRLVFLSIYSRPLFLFAQIAVIHFSRNNFSNKRTFCRPWLGLE